MKPKDHLLRRAGLAVAAALSLGAHAPAADFAFGPSQNFTITASDQARALGFSLGSLESPDGGAVFWRGSASDATYMHFDLSSLAGAIIGGSVSLNLTVNTTYGGVINSGQVSKANGAWSAPGAAPGFTAIGDSTGPTGSFANGATATWTIGGGTFQSYVGSPSFHGLVVTGGSGSTAHFSGSATLTGSSMVPEVRVSGGNDWSAVSWNDGTKTLTVSGNVSGGNLTLNPGTTLAVTGSSTLDSGNFTGAFTNSGRLLFDSSASQILSGPISGTGSLTKSGTGTLTFSGTNTHTGTTTVNSGTLAASSAGAIGGTALHIAAGARVNLNFSGQARVPQLLLNGVAQGEGTYGSTSSLAANKNNTYFSGTGVILVSSQTPAQAYAVAMQAWSAGDWTAVRSALDWVVSDARLPAKNRSISQLLIARSYQAQGNYTAANAAFAAVAADSSYPQIHRMEGEECAAEMNRLAQGLPARDPEASRIRLTPAPTPGRVLYVSPNGSDSNPGTQAQPFATVNAALAANRAAGPAAGGTLIQLADGLYPITSTISLTSADSGTAGSPLTIRAANPGKAVFYGGKRLSGFQTVTDTGILARLPVEARGQVMQCNLAALAIGDYGSISGFGGGSPMQPMVNLYVNGTPQTLARWPNSGFVRIASLVDGGYRDWTGQTPDRPQTFSYPGDRPSRWTTATDGWLHGYFTGSAYDASVAIGSVNPTAKTITTATLVANYTGWPEMNDQSTFRAFNLLEEIDQAGEWYLDRSSGMLYWYPSADPATAMIDLSLISVPMLTASNTSHVRIEGLVFDCSRGDGLKLTDSSDCILAGCTVRNLSGVAVAIEGGQRNKMIGCDLHNLDQAACKLIGGDRNTLEPGNHIIANSRFRNFGRVVRGGGAGVVLSGVANTISHCEFEDCPNTAISFAGPKHLVEFNSFRNCTNETDDSGVIASWGNPTYWGNIWRFNRFSHCGGGYTQGWVPHRHFGSNVFRFDDAISGQTVYGNIFDHLDQWGQLAGAMENNSGRDNFYDNNVVIDAYLAHAGYYNAGNDLYHWYNWTSDPPNGLTPTYLAAFPELANLYDGQGQNFMWRTIAARLQGSLPANDPNAWGGWNFMGNTGLGHDPGFLDGSELKQSIPASLFQSYGLRAIPVEEIGLYDDPTRAGWIDNPSSLYWNGGSGTWNTTGTTWSSTTPGAASLPWNDSGHISAVFSGSGGTVTTSGPVRTKGIKFANAGYTLGGSSPITLDAPDTVIDAGGHGASISAPLTGLGGIAVSAPGTLTLSAVNSYNGTTAVRLGTLALAGGDNRLPTGTVLTLGDAGVVNTGTLQLNGFNQELAGIWAVGFQDYHWGYFSGNRVINGSSTPCTLKLNIQTGYDQFVGTLGGPGQYDNNFAVTKTGAGTLMLGRSANWSGGTTIEQGTLELRSTFYQGNSASGTFRIGRDATFAVSGVVDSLFFNGVTVEFLPEGGGTFTNLGGSDWLNWQVNYGMAIRTTGGQRNLFSTSPNRSLNLNGQNLLLDVARGTDADSDLEVSIPLNNGGALTKQGGGIVTLIATNSWSGATTIHGGTLSVRSESLSGGALTINDGGTLLVSEGWAFGGNSPYGTNGDTIPSVTVNPGGVLHFNPENGHLAGITRLYLNGGSVTGGGGYFEGAFGTLFLANGNEQITAGGAATSTITSSIGLYGDNNLISVDADSTLHISGPVRNSQWWGSGDSGGFIKSGNGTLVLSGANSYSGTTSIDGGKVVLSGNVTATAAVTIATGSTLEVSGNLAVTGNVTNTGTLVFTGASQFSAGGTITNYGTIINSSPSMTLPGNITNHGTIILLPSAPLGLAATPGNGQVSLTWQTVAGVTGYEVRIAATSGGPYASAATVTAPNAIITGLTNGSTRFFVVRAINAAGQSPDSTEVSATPVGGLPLPYLTTDIGAVGLTGTATHNAGTFTLQGAGTGVNAATDAFRFVYQNSSGDCSITARVQSLTNPTVSAKTGVMIRESLAGNARCAGVYLTPANGVQFIWRSSTGAMASLSSSSSKVAPYWVRLTRTGNVFKAYFSANGTTWTQFGGNKSISMAATAYFGMATTSGTTSQLSTGVLTNLAVSP